MAVVPWLEFSNEVRLEIGIIRVGACVGGTNSRAVQVWKGVAAFDASEFEPIWIWQWWAQ